MEQPLPLRISVIIPVYNAERYLRKAVTSALQFDEVIEVILVDDGGPDRSLELCRSLLATDARIKLFQHPGEVNKGASASRNLGLANATGEYIAFLDADDHYLPERFDHERRIFRENPDADGVYGAIAPFHYDAHGKALYDKQIGHALTTVRIRVPPEDVFRGLTREIPDFGHFHLDALTLKRAALTKLRNWFKEELRLHQDTDFITRLAWHARLYPGSLDAPVSMRGVHADNRITRNTEPLRTKALMLRYRWEWARDEGLPPALVERFHYWYRTVELKAAPGIWQAIRIAFQSHYLDRYDYRDLFLDRITGSNERVKGVLHTAYVKVVGAKKSSSPAAH